MQNKQESFIQTKPVVYTFPVRLCQPESTGSRYLPRFTEDTVLAFDLGRWLGNYITKNLTVIDKSAYQQGKVFYYHPRDSKLTYLCDVFYAKPAEVFKEFIHYRFFDYQYGPTIALLRRLDDTRFLAWMKADIVKEDGSIYWPGNLFDNIADISYEDTMVVSISDPEMPKDNVRTDIQLADPNVSFDDFERHLYRCQECQREEVIHIEKGYDFYNIMETEYPCARCKKESFTISSGDLIFRWADEENLWTPQVASIALDNGYCQDCKPYFESKIVDLIVECSFCGAIMVYDDNQV